MRHAVTDPDFDTEYFTVEIVNDGRVMVTLGSPDYFVCLTPNQWRQAVKATASVWAHTEMVPASQQLAIPKEDNP